MMKEPTMEEVLELVEFYRDERSGKLKINRVLGNVRCGVHGSVGGSISGDVRGRISGDVRGRIFGYVWGDIGDGLGGTINGRKWQFIQTPKEKAIRLIREGKGEEAIKLLEESRDDND